MADGYCGKYLFNDTLQREHDGIEFNGTTLETKPSREFFIQNKIGLDFYFKHYWNNSVVNGMVKMVHHTLRHVSKTMT